MLTTKEVAAMLHVTETTVKRWADEKLLPCVRTAGGHRKFRLGDINGFAEGRGFSASGAQPPVMTADQLERLQSGVFTQNYGKVAGVLKEEALQADRDGLETLLLYLYRQHIPFPVILDEIVRPAFTSIGEAWEKGALDIGSEHAASYALAEALVRSTADFNRKEPNSRSVLCACLEGELHELGLRGVGYSFETEGWAVHFLGANTPAETILAAIRATRPDIVCLSVTTAPGKKETVARIRTIAAATHAHGGRLIIGGGYTPELKAADVGVDLMAGSTQDAIQYARDTFGLKPGPKRSSTQP